jgi:hypothetical protein
MLSWSKNYSFAVGVPLASSQPSNSQLLVWCAGQRRPTSNTSNQAARENLPAWLRSERVNFWAGVLQVDGYAVYKQLAGGEGLGGSVTLAFCWAHVRRKFYEIYVGGNAPIAMEALVRIRNCTLSRPRSVAAPRRCAAPSDRPDRSLSSMR